MNRYLFKAKRKDNNEWVYGYLFKTPLTAEFNCDGQYFSSMVRRTCISNEDGCVFEVIPETICEYTGKNDKNGKMIFENDYLKPPLFLDSEQRTCLCIYNQENNVNEIIGFGLYWNNSYFSKYQDLICSDEWEEFEVIGNKFDEGDNDE